MFILKKGHQPGVYVPLRALFLVVLGIGKARFRRINDDPGLTLTYFTARSNLVTKAFLYEKVKTVDFSETIAASDLKVSWSRHLIEYMMICEY